MVMDMISMMIIMLWMDGGQVLSAKIISFLVMMIMIVVGMVMTMTYVTILMVMMILMMMAMVMMMVANLKSDHPSIRLVQRRKDVVGVGTNIGWKYLYW